MRLRFLALALAGLAIAYGAIWYSLAQEAEDRIRRLLASAKAAGIEAEVRDLQTGGFPYRIELAAEDFTLRRRRSALPWSVRLPALDIFTHPWTPAHYVAGARDARFALGTVELASPQAEASWRRTDAAAYLDADLGPASLQIPGGAPVRAGRAELHVRLPRGGGAENAGLLAEERADLAFDARDVALGDYARLAPAPVMEKAALRLQVRGAAPLPMTAASLAAWRDAGGTLEVADLSADWGPAALQAEGSLSLDEDLRPLGALTVTMRRPGLIVRWLKAHGLIDARTAGLLSETVASMQAALGPGEPVTLPLTLQDGQAYLGPLPIAQVGPVI